MTILQYRCETPESEMKALISLTRDTHEILENFNLTHIVMFGRYSFVILIQPLLD